jgi:hypothetical protein
MAELENPWLSFAADAIRLGLEAQDVIGLRLIKAAWGGVGAREEAILMVVEKSKAAWDANAVITRSLMAGEGHLAPARALALYRRRVHANHRRLLGGG